jgi:hypothetical protein
MASRGLFIPSHKKEYNDCFAVSDIFNKNKYNEYIKRF